MTDRQARQSSELVTTLLAAALTACGGDVPCGADSFSRSVHTGLSEPMPVPASRCGAVITEEAEALGLHVQTCQQIVYASNPPSSGAHYPAWAAFRVYDTAVPRGFWMHSLEHGAVAILHACNDCAAEIELAKSVIDALPEDPTCLGTGALRRVLMTPDPLLDVPWAAAAWSATLRSRCFEPEVYRDFVESYGNDAPEDLCAPGRQF